MDEKQLKTIPYITFAVLEAKYKRLIQRLVLVLVATNIFYIILLLRVI